MWELFCADLAEQSKLLSQSAIEYEQIQGRNALESMMRAAHSIKGASKVMRLDLLGQLAHALEDILFALQQGKLVLNAEVFSKILNIADFFSSFTRLSEDQILKKLEDEKEAIQSLITSLALKETVLSRTIFPPEKPVPRSAVQERVLRVTAQNLNRLMGLAGESMVESRWLHPFSQSLLKIKKNLNDISYYLNSLREIFETKEIKEQAQHYLVELQHKTNGCLNQLSRSLADLEMFNLRHSALSDRLYREVIDSRMRPFADGVEGLPRIVRDLGLELHKKVRLEISGKNTPVDREILEKLEAPLNHLIRNAIDHGIELPEERISLGKSPEGMIRMVAQHRSGLLSITISDDGKGIDPEILRKKIIEMNLARKEVAEALSDAELFEFLFLPGFSTAAKVTEISGRGVGLNAVQVMLQEVSGTIRIVSEPEKGTSFHLLLPLTLSVIRALIVEIAGDPYAFPLSRIVRTLSIPQEEIAVIENKQYIRFQGENIGIIPSTQVLELEEDTWHLYQHLVETSHFESARQSQIDALRSERGSPSRRGKGDEEDPFGKAVASQNRKFQLDAGIKEKIVNVVILGDLINSYGVVVDRFFGERELVLQELDSRLGKIPDISAGALMEDGSPVLLIDVEDLVRSIDKILAEGKLHKITQLEEIPKAEKRKKILIVDDSMTVREVESRLLQDAGYEVQAAINGMDGWNALRSGHFDLVITDIDMPRMSGIELVRLIRSDERYKDLPVMVVSYKERDEDKLLGLEAGANYYLNKSNFQDEILIKAVADLVGKAH